MTCVVGIVDDSNRVWLASDSLGSGGGIKQEFLTPKLISRQVEIRERQTFKRYEPLLIGYTGSFRIGNVLTNNLSLPAIAKPVEQYMVCDFIPAVIEAFEHSGCLKEEAHVKSGGTFLVGVLGRLFEVQSDFSVVEPALGYTAIGSGQEFALGALWAVDHLADPECAARDAINAAKAFSTTVGGTTYVVST